MNTRITHRWKLLLAVGAAGIAAACETRHQLARPDPATNEEWVFVALVGRDMPETVGLIAEVLHSHGIDSATASSNVAVVWVAPADATAAARVISEAPELKGKDIRVIEPPKRG